MNKDKKSKKILVAALDWGLGHATRLIPIIQELKKHPVDLIFASSGNALKYWKNELPNETFIELPAYNPQYHLYGNMSFSMALQTPKFLKTIYSENDLLKKIVKQYNIDGIISDNRYGLFHQKIPSVIITHQLFIQTPSVLGFIKPVIKKINFQFIKQFTFCWVPDNESEHNVSGELSHSKIINKQIKFIGTLSRLEKKELPIQYDILILLSGPEPQRSILEQILLKVFQHSNKKIAFVCGASEKPTPQHSNNNITFFNVANTKLLNQLLNETTMVIARSGYSTIMDLLKLNKPAILIPTPGQTEQEYLADYLEEKKLFKKILQKEILKINLEAIEPIKYKWNAENNLLAKEVEAFINYL